MEFCREYILDTAQLSWASMDSRNGIGKAGKSNIPQIHIPQIKPNL